jgi:hypothetical protein
LDPKEFFFDERPLRPTTFYCLTIARYGSEGSSGLFPVEIQFLCTYEYYGADFSWRASGDVYVPRAERILANYFLTHFLGHSKVTVLYLGEL